MTAAELNDFGFLEQHWPPLYELARKAELVAESDCEMAAVRLRSYAERMVDYLFRHFELPVIKTDTLHDRLKKLERGDLLDRRLLAKFHTLRKFGNKGAHNSGVPAEKILDLLVDAWSLGCWFCRLIRPDIAWYIPPYGSPQSVPLDVITGLPDRQSTASTSTLNVFRYPEDRVRRIRDDVARAMATVDPRVRDLRTRLTIQEAFSDPLNDDQGRCIAAVDDFLRDSNQRVFLLKGSAGTGKTYVAQGIIEFLAAQGRACQIAAPTGRSAKIIGAKAQQEARTLHSLIYDFRNVEEHGHEEASPGLETFKFYGKISANRDQANTVYLIDEASLISDVYAESDFYRSGSGYLLQDLMEYIGFGNSENDRKIIFLGDPAQLAPVGMNTSPALDAEYLKATFGIVPTEYQLREVVRQAADSRVLHNVEPIRKSLDNKTFGGLSFDFGDDVQRIASDEEAINTYLQAVEDSKPDLPIIITRSNAEASKFNHAVRAQLFPEEPYVIRGDRLLISANMIVDGHFLANGEFVRVSAAARAIERRSVNLRKRNAETNETEVIEVNLIFRDVDLAIATDDGSEAILRVKILDDFLHQGDSVISAEMQRALYVDFLKRHPELQHGERVRLSSALREDPYFNSLRAKFGYAVTCHKAQGGEWKQVFVICPKEDPRNAQYYRWLYTAMTRASGTLYLVNPPGKIVVKVAGPDRWLVSDKQQLSNHDPAGISDTDELSMSPLEAFRSGLLTQLRTLLEGTNIRIADVAHYPYHEAYFFDRLSDGLKIAIHYNGQFEVTKITASQESKFRDELMQILAPLSGILPGLPATESKDTGVPSRPFLVNFHNQLLERLLSCGIEFASLREQQWSQRYTFQKGSHTVVLDVFYDGQNRLKTCVPIRPTISTPGADLSLLREILHVITDIIV